MWTQEEQEFYEMFQQAVNELREDTVDSILKGSEEYEKVLQDESNAEARYLQLKQQLTEEQCALIDEYIFLKEKSGLLYADAAYVAGIKNVLQVKRMMRL